MALPVTIPNTFANATSSIPLSQLDANFSTLSNAVNGINSGAETLANLKASNVTITGGTISNVTLDNVTVQTESFDNVTMSNVTITSGNATFTNVTCTLITNGAGTSAAPSITTTGDPNTGIFFPAADTIAFAEGGVEAMRIDSDGDVGIGTTAPATKLHVSGTSSAGYVGSYLDNTATNGYARLDLRIGSSGGSGLATVKYAPGIFMQIGPDSNDTTTPLVFATNNGTERMRIDSSGNVGIGTSSPGYKLDVSGEIRLNGRGTGFALRTPDYRIYNTSSNNALAFDNYTNEVARFTSGGYFKASNDGVYTGATGSYHELRNTVDGTGTVINSANNSFGSNAVILDVERAATVNYNFMLIRSGAGSDVEFKFAGDGNAYADGTWGSPASDYAEYFESTSGQQIPRGTTVVLENNKIRAATSSDPASSIIGVIRPKEWGKGTSVLGNSAWGRWKDKYLTDDFGVYIMEDHDVLEWEEQALEKEATEAVVDEEGNEVSPAQEAVYKTKQHSYESHNIPEGITVPADAVRKTHDEKGNKFQHRKLNPEYDAEVEYVSRDERPEWNIVGLLGQVPILKGQPTNDRWVKMRDVSATVEEWFIR